jgi:hypothetical protein
MVSLSNPLHCDCGRDPRTIGHVDHERKQARSRASFSTESAVSRRSKETGMG